MIARSLDTFFRHALLLVLPPLLIPLIVGPVALYMAPTYYETWAGIWVERPTYLSYNDDWNRYNTPAQNQTGRLNELLRTRSFVLEVAKKTPLQPLTTTVKGEEKIAEMFSKGLLIVPNGNQLVLVRFRAETPEISYQVVNALIETFRDKAAADRSSQALLAISFYESRLQAADEDFAKARDALRRYVAANPRLTSIDPTAGAAATAASRLGLPPAAIDPQLAELLRQLQVAEASLDRARNALDQAQLDASASMEGQQLGFQVVDRPVMPTTATRERRKMLIYPIAAMLVGFGVSSALLILLITSDGTARSEDELLATARVLGSVPEIQVRDIPKKAGADVARRAIGFPAGVTLAAPGGAK